MKNISVAFLALTLLTTCIDPVSPEYEIIDGLMVIEGQASSTPGTSFVNIGRTSFEFGAYRTIFQEGAEVLFRNLESGQNIVLIEQIDTYVPPGDFVVSTGETWELSIVLADGSTYRSLP